MIHCLFEVDCFGSNNLQAAESPKNRTKVLASVHMEIGALKAQNPFRSRNLIFTQNIFGLFATAITCVPLPLLAHNILDMVMRCKRFRTLNATDMNTNLHSKLIQILIECGMNADFCDALQLSVWLCLEQPVIPYHSSIGIACEMWDTVYIVFCAEHEENNSNCCYLWQISSK